MIEINIINLHKEYGDRTIIPKCHAHLTSDYIYFLTNENGGGKTTFFKCLLGIEDYEGHIDKISSFSYLPEKNILPYYSTPYKFLQAFFKIAEISQIEPLIDKYLNMFNILCYKHISFYKLSKGTKQKVLLIKTLNSMNNVLLFDEPLNGLDLDSRNIFMRLVNNKQKEGKLIIIASHYYDEYNYENKRIIRFV